MNGSRIPIPNRVRFDVLRRDRFTCRYCGRKAPDVTLECDHIHPVSKGGSNHILNLITACWECNGGKGAAELGSAAPVPAAFDGRNFRSRTHAHWAAFFTALGWNAIHDPVPIGTWAPDLQFESSCGGPILVHVSPDMIYLDQDTCDRIVKVCWEQKVQEDFLILLVGSRPERNLAPEQSTHIGWRGGFCSEECRDDWDKAYLTWEADGSRPVMFPDIVAVSRKISERSGDVTGWHGIMTDACGPGFPNHLGDYVDYASALWDHVGSSVTVSREGCRT